MLHIVTLSGRSPETDPTLSAVLAHAEEALKLLRANPHHHNADLAVHVMDLYTAAARIAARSSGDTLDMGHWQTDLSHLCEYHTYAAIFLLAATAPNTRDGAVILAHAGLDAVQQLLAQQ